MASGGLHSPERPAEVEVRAGEALPALVLHARADVLIPRQRDRHAGPLRAEQTLQRLARALTKSRKPRSQKKSSLVGLDSLVASRILLLPPVCPAGRSISISSRPVSPGTASTWEWYAWYIRPQLMMHTR
jgi:hypothetical protein